MFSCKLGTKEKTWVSLSQSLIVTHTLLFHILSHFSFSPFLLFYACVHVFGGMFLTFCIFSYSYYQPTRETVYSASASRRDAQSTYGRNAYVWLWMKQLWSISWPNNIILHYINSWLLIFCQVMFYQCNYVNIYRVPNAQVVLWPPKDVINQVKCYHVGFAVQKHLREYYTEWKSWNYFNFV